MKKKLKTPSQSPLPMSMTEGLIPGEEVTKEQVNGKSNGKTSGTSSEKPPTKDLEFSDVLDNRELLKVLSEVRHGNFSVRMPIDRIGLSGKICDTLNEIISLNETLVDELNEARNTIGKQGHLNHRVSLPKYAKC